MTPSKLRRQGREAFDPSIDDPNEICPYGVLTSPSNYGNWMEGWKEGETLHQIGKPRKAFGVELDEDPIGKTTMTKTEKAKYDSVMSELDDEWDENSIVHKTNRFKVRGIRSSQISALVALLIKKGVLK